LSPEDIKMIWKPAVHAWIRTLTIGLLLKEFELKSKISCPWKTKR